MTVAAAVLPKGACGVRRHARGERPSNRWAPWGAGPPPTPGASGAEPHPLSCRPRTFKSNSHLTANKKYWAEGGTGQTPILVIEANSTWACDVDITKGANYVGYPGTTDNTNGDRDVTGNVTFSGGT